MKTIKELIKAVNNKTPLIWNDPNSIEGSNYTITYIEPVNEEEFDIHTPILIQYGGGSEAQVYLHEIIVKL